MTLNAIMAVIVRYYTECVICVFEAYYVTLVEVRATLSKHNVVLKI